MSRRPGRIGATLRILGALALALVAVLAALLAADTRAWRVAFDRGQTAYAASPADINWRPSTHLGGLAASILGVGDDVAMRQGIALYERVTSKKEFVYNFSTIERFRSDAELALEQPAAARDPSLASEARMLLGLLSFGANTHGGGITAAQAAVSDFTQAVTADSSNTVAKYDLELLLRLSATGRITVVSPSHGLGRKSIKDATSGANGRGY